MKPWVKVAMAIFMVFFILLFFLSTIIRVYVVNNSEKIIKRKVDLKELHINYLKFSASAKDFVLYEKNGTDPFVSVGGLYVDFAPWHLLRHEYAFSEIRIDKPSVSITYSEKGFNFDDLMTSSDSTEVKKEEDTFGDTVRYLVRNLSISDGYIRYEDKTMQSVNELRKIGLAIPEIAWDNSRSELGVDFVFGEDGKVSVNGAIDQKLGTYSVGLKTSHVDISPFAAYLKPYMEVSAMKGFLDGAVTISGEMANPMNLNVVGKACINDLGVTDKSEKTLLTASSVLAKMDSIDLKNLNFTIDSIEINNPNITAILSKSGINLMNVFNPMFADTASTAGDSLSYDTATVHYAINHFIVNNGVLAFSDQTLNRPFSYDLTKVQFSMENFSDVATNVLMNFSMLLNNSGTFTGKAGFDYVTMKNIEFDGSVHKMDMISFSPYFEYFLARPVKKGVFNYDCQLSMNPTSLKNNNSIQIVNLEFGKKTKDTTAYKVPIPLALYILKDRKGVIGFDLPVTGNPSDPKFKLGRLIWKTAEEFFLKSATAPFNAIGKLISVNPDNIKKISFEFLQDSLTLHQRENLDQLAEAMKAKPELSFLFNQTTHPEMESNLIAVSEAKKRFLSGNDSTITNPAMIKSNAGSLSNDDVSFRSLLGIDASASDSLLYQRCRQLVGNESISQRLMQLMNIRENLLKEYFNSKGIPQTAIQFQKADLRNIPEELKKPQFLIDIAFE
ncbi:MAG TPA: DUF748 domain-containing protein [Prolixibacteraceae bacterium]|nr:DUF748 domain-containing protein [Prolixibacteraceae bacterium]